MLRPLFFSLFCSLAISPLFAQTPPVIEAPEPAPGTVTVPEYTQTEIIYGRKFGVALTMDVIQPKNPNGYGVIFVVSGGWRSIHEGIKPVKHSDLLGRGYTIFNVVPGSQPKFTILEMIEDLHRAVRYIRKNAAQWGVNPDKLGLSGGSAGGHLSLCIATMGAPGRPSGDAVNNASSAVQAVAVFYPPTDFLNYGKPGFDATGTTYLASYAAAFGPESYTPEGRQRLGKDISPINFITPAMPPVLIIHGDKDETVPVQQGEIFIEKAKAAGVSAALVVKPGAGHGWKDIAPDYARMADFFDLHLRGIKK